MSFMEARNTCIGEALEFYSAAFCGNEIMRSATISELPNAVDPREILLFSDLQYTHGNSIEETYSTRHAVPQKFDPARPIDWLPGTNLVDNTCVWLPAACCLIGYKFSPSEPAFASADRSGLAVGRSVSDALASALLELVEHDAVAIWWYNRIRRPEAPLEDFKSPTLDAVKTALRKLGRRLWLLDVTTDLAIPSYIAVSALENGTGILYGAASHPSPRIAAEKAATEIPQLLLCLKIAKMPPGSADWLQKSYFNSERHFEPISTLAPRLETGFVASQQIVDHCIDRMTRCGITPFFSDLTRADVAAYAVRAIACGVRSICNRRGPGRLYDVPVRLGWLPKSLEEAQLNPLNCVF
jgi:ribosomal protein S12 methylthiotransferase accessory factor